MGSAKLCISNDKDQTLASIASAVTVAELQAAGAAVSAVFTSQGLSPSEFAAQVLPSGITVTPGCDYGNGVARRLATNPSSYTVTLTVKVYHMTSAVALQVLLSRFCVFSTFV